MDFFFFLCSETQSLWADLPWSCRSKHRVAAQQLTTCPRREDWYFFVPQSHFWTLPADLPKHLMLCSPSPKCKERKITCGCKNLGCFTGIAAGCTTHEPESLVPRLGRLDMDLYFPLHSQLKQTGKKSSCLTCVPGLYQHPILLGKVFPGTIPTG